MRLALAQVNPTVGDLAGNAAIVVERTREAVAAGADLVVFPEMMLTGYPIEDLALRRSFQQASRAAIADLARQLDQAGCGGAAVVVGFLDAAGPDAPEATSPGYPRGGARNAAAVIHGGEVVAVYAKHHLPNYGVFDEFRYFVPGDEGLILRLNGVDVAVAICEDLWQPGGPVAQVRAAGAGLLVVINGSPYERAKDDLRLDLCQRRAAEAGCTLAYVIDGDSMVVDAEGEVLARAFEFVEQLVVLDLELPPATAGVPRDVMLATDPAGRPALPAPVIAPELPDAPEVYRALVLGLRDYVGKNGFSSVALGLSGGIDSALVAAMAVDALGKERVHCVMLPYRYTSPASLEDAAGCAHALGLRYDMVPIYMNSAAYTKFAQDTFATEKALVEKLGLAKAQ